MLCRLALAVALAVGSSVVAAPVSNPGAGMAEAAKSFVAALDAEQRALACLPFESPERENWAFVPKARAGLPLSALTKDSQRKAHRQLLASALSAKGLLKADTIIALEALLAEIEHNPTYRDATKYFTLVFGDPASEQKPWGWRFEGHHLSVNLTIFPNRADGVFVTPSFLGANPAEVREGPKQGTRPLAAEEDLARSLATTLHDAGKPVLFTDQAPREILTAADRKAKQLDPVGVAVTDMNGAQKNALNRLIEEYAGRHRPEIVASELARIRKQFDTIRFGWAGSLKTGEAYYYRVQGKTFLIEAANSQNNANHIHTVWRDLANDFGRDALGEHYQDHDHPH